MQGHIWYDCIVFLECLYWFKVSWLLTSWKQYRAVGDFSCGSALVFSLMTLPLDDKVVGCLFCWWLCLQMTRGISHLHRLYPLVTLHHLRGEMGIEMQLRVWTWGLPCSLVKGVSLYVMGNLGQSWHVDCIEQALWEESASPSLECTRVELLVCGELNIGDLLSVLVSTGVMQGADCAVWFPRGSSTCKGREILGEGLFREEIWCRNILTNVERIVGGGGTGWGVWGCHSLGIWLWRSEEVALGKQQIDNVVCGSALLEADAWGCSWA